MTSDFDFSPDVAHRQRVAALVPALAFDPARPYAPWRAQVQERLTGLLGDMPERVEPDIRIQYCRTHDGYEEIRFIFRSEAGADVPCHLLLPTGGQAPYPLVICLQGHSTGMHISLGRALYPGDEQTLPSRDIAVQAVRRGYAALALEQRCFGERRDTVRDLQGDRCRHASWQALMLGRTMLGERVWDVSRAIDVLAAFEQVDTGRIALTGNSGGGTATWYAACMEPRIRIAAPSCSICGLWPSIGEIIHCHCNYIPNMLRWFDMSDLACLIAPRPLAIAAGLSDAIFPIESTQAQFATIQAIYAAAGAPDACSLHVGEGGHQYYPGLLWPVIDRHMAALR